MKPGLLFLPFIALIAAAIGAALGSSLVKPLFSYLGLGIGLSLVLLWVGLDLENFKRFFGRKGAKYGASSGLVVLAGITIIVLLAFVTNRPRFNKSYDATKAKTNTLADQSIKIIEKIHDLKDPIKVTVFYKQEDIRDEVKNLLKLYLNRNAQMAVEYVDSTSNPTRAMAEKIANENTAIFRLGNQEAHVTTFTEEKITNAILQVLKIQKRKIYFTSGHGERSITSEDGAGATLVVEQLKNNKYEVAELALLEQAKVPDDADLLVIAGPKYDFKEEETRFLADYLGKGGSLFVMVDALTQIEKLAVFLQEYGIKFNEDLAILRPDDPRAQLLGSNNAIITEFDEFNPITKDMARGSAVSLLLPNTRTVTAITENKSGFKVSVLAKTSKEIVKINGVHSQKDLANIDESRVESGNFPVFAVSVGKAKQPTLASNQAGATNEKDKAEQKADSPKPLDEPAKEKEARIVALGTSELTSNGQMVRQEHLDLFLNVSNYLLQDEDFISLRPKDSTKSELNLATGSANLSLIFISIIYPFCFLGFGVWYWLRRRAA